MCNDDVTHRVKALSQTNLSHGVLLHQLLDKKAPGFAILKSLFGNPHSSPQSLASALVCFLAQKPPQPETKSIDIADVNSLFLLC